MGQGVFPGHSRVRELTGQSSCGGASQGPREFHSLCSGSTPDSHNFCSPKAYGHIHTQCLHPGGQRARAALDGDEAGEGHQR